MRKLLLVGIFLYASIQGMAQTGHHIGFIGGQTKIEQNGQTIFINVNGGQVIQSGSITTEQDQSHVTTGFPYPVSYFNTTFDQDFFVSKGYFPDVVQLNWQILTSGENIERLLLYRKPLGSQGDSLLVGTLAADEFSFRDEFVEGGILYKYTLFAKGVADDLRIPFVNFIESTGFSFPVGTATGRITFEGGTAVEGVTVLAETDGNLRGKSIFLDGENEAYLRFFPRESDTELDIDEGFSVQFWTRFDDESNARGTLFSRGSEIDLSYDGATFDFKFGDVTANLAYEHPVDSFFHVAAVYDPTDDYIGIYARKNNREIDSVRVDAGSVPSIPSGTPIEVGRNNTGAYYTGYVDEIRVWNQALSFEDIKQNFSRFLSGSEEGLGAYWRLTAGVANEFYDLSREGGFDFNENHGQIIRAEWSEVTPFNSQLAYRGLTDSEGNYTLSGFPFESQGSLYTFTPILDNHSFEPNQQLRFVGDGTFIFNEVDFEDVSSFPVSGTIYYKNTPFPVEGVNILIDGRAVVNADNELVATDANGTFTVDVPIGFHSITANLAQHGFENDGRFPPATTEEEFPLFNFQEPLAGLVFQDTTLVKLAGRVTGGPREANKPLGFGRSENNIGNATIFLRPQKLNDLTFREFDSLVVATEFVDEDDFVANTTFNIRDIEINADPESGEFIAFLPPEKYVVNDVRAGIYDFDETFNVTIDLQNTQEELEEIQELVDIEVDGSSINTLPPFDPASYDEVIDSLRNDTTFVFGIKSFDFQKRQDFNLRLTPTIDVLTLEGDGRFGEEEIEVIDELTGASTTIDLINDDGSFAFGLPVFQQRSDYTLKISLFEEYLNDDTGETDLVPVTDGSILISNELAINNDPIDIPLNGRGEATYTFFGGLPSLSVDGVNPENSFTNVLNITAFSGNLGAIRTVWREADPFRGYILGGVPTGNNFVTAGPNQVDMILRDPPGTGSYSYLEQGSSVSSSNTFSASNSLNGGGNIEIDLGSEQVISGGLVPTPEIKTENVFNTTFGFEVTDTYATDSTVETTLSFSETISTSDDPTFVGRDGDLFIGRSTNIVYGLSNLLDLIPVDQCETCLDTEVSGYRIGTDLGLRVDPQFSTGFAFSQFEIEQNLIPELKDLRNTFLVFSENPESVVATDGPVYVSLIPPTDERFGSSNKDVAIWGDEASLDLSNGPSYQVIFPADFEGSPNDTVAYYNQSIADWIFWLAFNEEQKLDAKTLDNRSFDAGAIIEQTISTSSTTTVDRSYEFNVDESFQLVKGFEVFGVGTTTTISLNTSSSVGQSSSNANTEEETFGFVLADGDLGDSYTVDIREPEDGFGPVFSTRGGATSCPFEDEVTTKYFEPGSLLSAATAQREVPDISVETNVVSDVPDNREAVFNIDLRNLSETGDGFEMQIAPLSGSNPNGASLSVNGSDLGDGLVFNIPAGQTVNTTLAVGANPSGETDYENIGIILSSLCQADPNDNLAIIADTVFISAFFIPGCSDIVLDAPLDQWVLNTRNQNEEVLTTEISGYDLNTPSFERIDFQYKPASSSQWITDMRFYNPQIITEEVFEGLDDPKMMIEGTSISYDFDMGALPDREYDIRAVSRCVLGPGNEVFTPTEIARGTKDTKRPQLFGAPQPADGILSANDEISIRFDEDIEAGLLNNSSLSIRGILNGTALTNSVSVSLDGIDDYVRVPNIDLSNRSFTVFSWLRRQNFDREEVIYSHGNGTSDVFEYGFTSDNRFFVQYGAQRQESALTFPEPPAGTRPFEWISVTIDNSTNELMAYRNGEYILERVALTESFSGTGPVSLGRSEVSRDRYFTGNMHELRIWSRSRSLGDEAAFANQGLIGNEVGLLGYWPMDEAFGTLALDRARFRNAIVFGDWNVEPKGSAFSFDGVDDYVEINTGSTVVIADDKDFTIEMWFNGLPDQGEAVLFSNGTGDGTDEVSNPEDTWFIGFNAAGELVISNNTTEIVVENEDGSYLDNNWHHLAVSVSRLGNINVLIDLEQVTSVPSSDAGGLLGSRMWIGARGFRTSNVETAFDRHFAGLIDEFRIWDSFRRSGQVSLNWNSRIIGDEIDLVAYYPFDDFELVNGIQILESTLEDQFDNPFGDNGGLAEAFGGADFELENTPNIKLARPVQQVDFDFAVNEDEIILTPAPSFAALIEQTTLEISLRTVEDLFENRLASPVSWTAFVDRNQVKWGDSDLTFEKGLNEELTFAVDITNFGGQEQSYSIDNLPVWLTASDPSGTIPPLTTVTVNFEINPGLNVGHYERDLFLTADLGFNEKLTLSLDVFAEAPDWEVDPADFQFSMNVVGQLRVQGVVSRDRNDRIAAFVNDEIRGVTNLVFVPELDNYLAFLDIYSNATSNETIEFRMWDSSTGREYRDLTPSLSFETNQVYGSPKSPQIFDTGETFNSRVSFSPGWTWRSFNMEADKLENSNALLEGVSAINGDQVKSQSVVDVYAPGVGWIGTIAGDGGYQTGTFYQFYLQNGGEVDITGSQGQIDLPISIQEGWNFLGFTPPFNLSVDESFASFGPSQGDIVKSQFEFSVYDDDLGWVGTLTSLKPTEGYLFQSSKSGTLTYPEVSFLNASSREEAVFDPPWPIDRHQYQHNMTLVAQAPELPEGAAVGAFIDGTPVGSGHMIWISDQPLYFLTISGNEEGQKVTFKAVDPLSNETIALAQSIPFVANNTLGDLSQPFELTLFEQGYSSMNAYPNPFTDEITIAVEEALNGAKVYDLSGQLIKDLALAFPQNASIIWDGANKHGNQVPPGIYFIELQYTDHIEKIKVWKE